MNYQLAKQLGDAGFPLIKVSTDPLARRMGLFFAFDGVDYYEPSLDELIEVCGENFGTLSQHVERKLWEATSKIEKDKPAVRGMGATPSEAVASLWLAWMNEVNKP